MSILSRAHSKKEKPAHNFSQKISEPSSVMIMCSDDFVEFLESLWGLGILLQSYKNTLVVVYKKEWKLFIEQLYPEMDFSFIDFTELGAGQEIESCELIVFLARKIPKETKSYLKLARNAVIAGMSSFSDIKFLNCIISVNDLQSYYYQFFSFALQLAGTSEKWDSYIRRYNFLAAKGIESAGKETVFIDISPGIHGTRFLKKHVHSLVAAIQKNYNYDVVLIDWDARYYDKLVFNKCKTKPDFQLIVSHEQALDVLKSCTLFISPNTHLLHFLRYTHLRTFSILVPHERRHHCETTKNRTHIVHTFTGLRIKNILPQIKELL